MDKKIIKISFICLFVFGCTRKAEESSVLRIQLPTTAQVQSHNKTENGTSDYRVSSSQLKEKIHTLEANSPFNTLLNPTALSEFDCYAIFVGGGTFNGFGTCNVTDGTSFSSGAAIGGFPAGQVVSLTVPSGQRTIRLIGFNVSEAADCHDYFSQNIPEQRVSYPHVLAKTDFTLPPGDASVSLTAAYSTNKITSCNFSAGGGSGAYFGNGSDGNITVSASTLNLDSTPSPTSGRFLTSTSKVTQIDNVSTAALPDRVDVTVQASWTTANVNVGDEVVLYVAASSGASACGNGLAPGLWTSGIVRSYAGSSVLRLEVSDSRFLSVASSQLAAIGYGTSPDFCRIIAIRVPHINNLTINYAGTVQITSNTSGDKFDITEADHTNKIGIAFMRIAGVLTVESGTTAEFNVTGAGYKGGDSTRKRGQGIAGQRDNGADTAVENGGGYEGIAGSGGGHGGTGGATNGGGVVGDLYGCSSAIDPLMKCLKGKFFMGGGGGYDSNSGGAGGGAVRILAHQIAVNGTLNVEAKGGSYGSLDDAGGAGGSIYISTNSFVNNGGFNFLASGGNGYSTYGGAGGGGRIHVKAISSSGTGGTNAQVAIGTGNTTGASAGSCYAEGITISGCP